jgi:NAD(P)H-dependent FMN reductase
MRSTSSFEWNNKAAGFVDYGSAGGVRAVEHLRLVMAEVQVATARNQVALSLYTDYELHHLQTGCPPREIGKPDARSVD